MSDLDVGTLKAEALAVLAALKDKIAAPARVAQPASDRPVATAPGADAGKVDPAGAPVSEPPAAVSEPTTASPEALRERLEASVLDLSVRAALAPYLPQLHKVLFAAIRPLVRLEESGRVLFRADDGSEAELNADSVRGFLGDVENHFIPSRGLSSGRRVGRPAR